MLSLMNESDEERWKEAQNLRQLQLSPPVVSAGLGIQAATCRLQLLSHASARDK